MPSSGADARRRLLVATRSPHKLAELRTLIDLPATDLVGLEDLGIEDDPVEDGATFTDNAFIKVRWGADRSGLPTLADDSGIEVEALGSLPGVRTRRYAGEDATDDENNAKLLATLGALHAEAPEARRARYVCVLGFVDPALPSRESGGRDEPILVTGTFEGRIAAAPRGTGGFGYDPIFEPDFEPPGGRTVGQMSQTEKDAISHRAKAARAMGETLRRLGY
jgi:XTP/dITP diphosphohydrolase